MHTGALCLECLFPPTQWTPFFQAPSVTMATPRLLREGQSLFVVVQSLFEGQWGYSPWGMRQGPSIPCPPLQSQGSWDRRA